MQCSRSHKLDFDVAGSLKMIRIFQRMPQIHGKGRARKDRRQHDARPQANWISVQPHLPKCAPDRPRGQQIEDNCLFLIENVQCSGLNRPGTPGFGSDPPSRTTTKAMNVYHASLQ